MIPAEFFLTAEELNLVRKMVDGFSIKEISVMKKMKWTSTQQRIARARDRNGFKSNLQMACAVAVRDSK